MIRCIFTALLMSNRISILIITYNRPADLLELLINLSGQTGIGDVLEEILILNNASTESYCAVADYVKNTPLLRAKYIVSSENLGVARGRNKLMQEAHGNLILSLDDDMVFTKQNDITTLSKLFDEPFFSSKNTGIITFRVIYYETREVQITAFPHKMYEKYKSLRQFHTAYFAGGAHIMKREVIKQTGLYPEDFHYGMEEYDLSYRALNAGYTIAYDDKVTVAHKESPLGRQPGHKKLQMQWINKSKVAWRYLPFRYFVSTAVAWAIQYIKTAKGHPGTFLSALGQIILIPFSNKRSVVSNKTISYLKEVEARLKY